MTAASAYVKDAAYKLEEFIDGWYGLAQSIKEDVDYVSSKIKNVYSKSSGFKGFFRSIISDTRDVISYAKKSLKKFYRGTDALTDELFGEKKEPFEKGNFSAHEGCLEDILKTENIEAENYLGKNFAGYAALPKEYKKTYTTYISEIKNSYSGYINDVAHVVSGRAKNSVPRRASPWRWSDRVQGMKQMLENYSLNSNDKKGLEEVRYALSKNKYLRYKKKEIYAEIKSVIDKKLSETYEN